MNECTLIYEDDGFAWVHYSVDSRSESLETESFPKSSYPTLMQAYQAAVRLGHDPTHWSKPKVGVRLPIDHADHWRKLAGL